MRAAEWARVRGRAVRPRIERTCPWVNFVGGFVLPADLTGDRQVERVPCLQGLRNIEKLKRIGSGLDNSLFMEWTWGIVARPLRIDMEEVVYHVTSRGWERRVVVRNARDWRRWRELLDRVATRWAGRVFAWPL